MEKLVPNGSKWGQELFFPTNPDLADILGNTDFDFENFYFWDLLDSNFPDFRVPKHCFYWGAATPQTPCCSWGASSPPHPWHPQRKRSRLTLA